MKRFAYIFIAIMLVVCGTKAQTIREMKFENTKLETVIKALAEVSGMNVVFDPAISGELQKTVNIAIYRPVPVGEAFNIILKEFNLIAVPADKRVYRITKAGEITFSFAGLEEEKVKEIINFLKTRVSPSAEIVVDRSLKTIYIRDEEKNINKIAPVLKDIRKLTEAVAPKEELITRVFYLRHIKLDEAEKRIKPYTKPQTIIRKAYDFSALVITDTARQMSIYEKVLQNFLTQQPSERRPVTKIFYLKYISPEEFTQLIEPLRSEASVILSGGALRLEERPQTQQPQAQQGQAQTAKAPTPVLREFNAVMITDYPEVIEEIKQRFKDYISDVPIRVQIEARIVEIRQEALRELGINWSLSLSQAGVPEFWSGGVGSNIGIGALPSPAPGLSATPGSILLFSYQRGQLNALNLRLSALERVALVKSLAKPTIITINAQKATIRQGVQVPYQTAAAGPGGTAVSNVQFKDVVLELNVTPIVSPDNRIMLELEIKRDTLGVSTPSGPAINTKEARTKVVVENGQTVVIGGIIDNQDNRTTEGVPGLIRVPLLKYLFGQERINLQDGELLIFITPTIITQ